MCIRSSSSVSTRLRETDSTAHHQISLLLLLLLIRNFPPFLIPLLCYLFHPSFFSAASLQTRSPLCFQALAGFPSTFRLPTSATMAFSLRKGFSVSSSAVAGWNNKKPLTGGPPSSLLFSPWKREFRGEQVVLRDQQAGTGGWDSRDHSVHTQATSFCVPPSMRWWEKGEAPNMMEIGSTQELVDSLFNAGDRLVVVDFYSPGCGGCKALHPKICQFAETNPDVLFLKVNYEEHKSMCNSLNVHVLPFFRFYRGAHGRVCSFSCTNATIKKFKDGLAKHGGERCEAGRPAKGLEESELLKLAANGELQFNPPLISTRVDDLGHHDFPGSLGDGVAEAERRMTALSP
ncbi:hypothetical protein Taro_049702 [Colocasia esculenta]|uniref:Thioredoxin domain-containing protein n=1 Tax=Colocasia esculenta TaxID=4460 RepID=A0A843XBR5_COLES|nr:hypothetical protein [Colocasia esculenta]